YTLADDPVKAAADIATKAWSSSNEAVVVVDGSGVTDEVTEILSKETTLNVQKKVTQVMANSDKWKEFEGNTVYPMLIGRKWGIIHVDAQAHVDTFLICPNYMEGATDWWPYDHNRDDMWHPVILPGPYAVGIASQGDFPVIITLYSCDRYKVSIPYYDASLKVTLETDEPTYLWAYLIDSRGNIIAPDLPSWCGAEVPPFKIMPGNVSQGNEEEFDHLYVEPHTEFSFEAHHLKPGKYTIIVVPREDMSGSVNYRIKAELRTYSSDRLNYGLSAANGAVIASLKHIPLLYANEDGLPDETVNALNKLGVSNVIFVDLANNEAVANELAANYNVERITTMNDIVSKLQELGGEKYVTVTSFTTYDGYFAPAAYLAAYHGSPVVRIGEMGEAYYWGNVALQWMFYAGDYYHGTRSIGHLPMARKPIMDYIKEGEIPPLGLDAELRWFRRIVEGVFNYANSIGVDTSGMEAYGFVAPKTDIRFTVHHALFGNESTAGQFIGKTAGELAAQVVRSVLYPAIIFGNPHRNITTSSLMNYQDGNQATANNGERFNAYTSRYTALYFNMFGREFRGHCRWDNLYVDQNGGASLYYYSGHGTGGGGISYHPEFAGPDAWRGYAYWNGKTARAGGFTWYDVDPPNQYNLVHFKWADYYWENLHSQFVMWMSCTTFAHYGPEIYLEHGAVAAYGNANTGLSPHCEIYDIQFMKGCLYEGKPIGVAFSEIYWKFERDFTTMDPTSIYGGFALNLDSDQVIYGDPMLYVYSPAHWVEPTPVESPL
ncbi:MAG: hypothetical protein J7L58_02685, partial [Thermoplasmata archaeon]|nr:hypothetical protein [Thermoplasmata archaeon]